ncbi:MAG: beta-ketoacyl synthase [Halorhabdus sp.]
MARTVHITGVGAITPVGLTAEDSWRAITEGQSGITALSRFDPEEANLSSKIAGEVDFDTTASEHIDDQTMGRYAQFAVAASFEAIADAGLSASEWPCGADRVGVSIGSGMGGYPEIADGITGDRIDPYFSLRFLPNLAAGHVSEAVDAKGPNRGPATACATGTHSIGEAMRDIREGRADIMIAGGTEAVLSPTAVRGFDSMRALSTRNDTPTEASRPFDADRDGFVMAEGAGVVVLEADSHAVSRDADPIASVIGYARTADAHHPTKPPDDAHGLRRSIQRALADADREPEDVDHINAHGTSTPRGDPHEATAVEAVFDEAPPVTSTKSMLGHTLGASGAIEAAITAKAVQEGRRPPTINYETPDPECDIPIVHETEEMEQSVAISNSAGFGGTNGSLIIEEADAHGI